MPTPKEIKYAERVREIALAVRQNVAAMRPTYAQASDVFSALYREALVGMLSEGLERFDFATEIDLIVEKRFHEAFDRIAEDLKERVDAVQALNPAFMVPLDNCRTVQ